MQRPQSLLVLYDVLYRIVKGWPASYSSATSQETRSQRINTFAVIRSMSDFDADNAKKDMSYTGKTFFFSRSFDSGQHQPNALRVQYPALGIREDTFQLNDPLDAAGAKRRMFHNLTIILADQIPDKENTTIDPVSSQRTIEEVGNDLRIKASQLLLLIGRFVYVKAYLASTLVFEGWYDENHIETLAAAGVVIDQYSIEDMLLSFITGVTPTNAEVFYSMGGDNLAILAMPLIFETSSCPVSVPAIIYDDPTDVPELSKIFEQDIQAGS